MNQKIKDNMVKRAVGILRRRVCAEIKKGKFKFEYDTFNEMYWSVLSEVLNSHNHPSYGPMSKLIRKAIEGEWENLQKLRIPAIEMLIMTDGYYGRMR